MFSKNFQSLSCHDCFDSRNRNTRSFHLFTSESVTNAYATFYVNRRHVIDDSHKMRQNNAEHEHESRSISNTSKDLKRAQARINKAVIVQKLSIFDKHRVRLMSESDTIRSRALKISSTTKKENRRSSRRSLKAEMKDLLRHHARVEFD